MSYLIVILGSLFVLVSFVLWAHLETTRGFRVGGPLRKRLDRHVSRTGFVLTHIDWHAFTRHVARTTAERVAHDIVHTTLVVVRAVERTLTRLIRSLRARVATHEPSAEPVEGSQLIATLIRFRKSFRKNKEK